MNYLKPSGVFGDYGEVDYKPGVNWKPILHQTLVEI
jgi:hypothetical protein